MDIDLLLDLNCRSKIAGSKHVQKRSLFHTLRVGKRRHMTGILERAALEKQFCFSSWQQSVTMVFILRQAGFSLNYLKSTRGKKIPDFLLEYKNQKFVFEIGGKGKGREQFKNVQADRKIVLAEDVDVATDKMPLYLIGFMA